MGKGAHDLIMEEYLSDEVSFVTTYGGAFPTAGISICYFNRDQHLTVESYRGILKAMMRLDERIGSIG